MNQMLMGNQTFFYIMTRNKENQKISRLDLKIVLFLARKLKFLPKQNLFKRELMK